MGIINYMMELLKLYSSNKKLENDDVDDVNHNNDLEK